MRIFGPLVCSTTFADTVAAASASAPVVRSSPSTNSNGTSETTSPGSPTIFSTVTTSSTATLYCLPPVLTIAYIDALLQSSGDVVRSRRGWPGRHGLVPQLPGQIIGARRRTPGYGTDFTRVKPGRPPPLRRADRQGAAPRARARAAPPPAPGAARGPSGGPGSGGAGPAAAGAGGLWPPPPPR